MATMLDVSRKAGVSKSTVSRVLNGTAKISEATREAVFKAIEELIELHRQRQNIQAAQAA